MEIAKRVKAIRKCKKLPQTYIAQRLNITQQSYSSFENKAGGKMVNQLIQVAQVLDVDVCLILAFEIPINKDTVLLRFSDLFFRSQSH